MSAHSVLLAVAACAPGKHITVFVPSGKIYELPMAPAPAPMPPPDPLEVLSQQLLERDAVTRASVAEIAARADETLQAVRDAVDTVAAGQAGVVESVNELTGTMHLPVKPIYDAAGKLIAAQRVAKRG